MKKLYLMLLFNTLTYFGYTQNCNTWLKVTDVFTGATAGDLDITGNQVTIEATCNGLGDFTRSLVSKHGWQANVNYFLCPDLAQITTTNGFFSTSSPCSYQNNKTYHVAMVYDGSSLKLYRNGFLMSQTPATGNLITNNWPVTFGENAYQLAVSPTVSNVFKGVINNIRIWNVARTQAEIRTYMNIPLPNPTTQIGLKGYYIFDDLNNKQGNTAYNVSLTGNVTINATNPNCQFVADSCAPLAIPCNTWLKVTDVFTGATAGDLDITGNQVTIEATCNGLGDLTRSLVSKHGWQANVNYFLCPDLAQITTTNGFFSTSSPCSYQNNKTYHVALVYDGSSLKLYRNGFLMSQTPATGNLITNNWPVTFGENAYQLAVSPTVSNIFKGVINNIRIWNVARTQAEIRDNMSILLPNPTTQVGLMGYYIFDNLNNKQGNTAFNVSLRGNVAINAINPDCTFTIDSCNIVTPVKVSSFFATVNNKAIQVNWHTEEEIGISKYIIERSSSSNGPYAAVGSINARNNSNSGGNYLFTDNTAKSNIRYFYRLQIVEYSGEKKYSLISDAIIQSIGMNVNVYPNPTNDFINVNIENAKEAVIINVYNNLGQLLLNNKPFLNSNTNIQLNLSQLVKGMYWLKITSGEKTVVKKIERL